MSNIENIDDGKVYDSKDKHQIDDEANINYSEAFTKYPSTNDGDIEDDDDDDFDPDDDTTSDSDAGGDVEGTGDDSGGVESI